MFEITGNKDFLRWFKERRRGKDRRKHLDPRYRNPDYPEFFDKRKGNRRKPEYETRPSFITEHPNRRWVTVIGIMTVSFLLYASVLTTISVDKKPQHKIGNMNTHQVIPYLIPWSF